MEIYDENYAPMLKAVFAMPRIASKPYFWIRKVQTQELIIYNIRNDRTYDIFLKDFISGEDIEKYIEKADKFVSGAAFQRYILNLN